MPKWRNSAEWLRVTAFSDNVNPAIHRVAASGLLVLVNIMVVPAALVMAFNMVVAVALAHTSQFSTLEGLTCRD